MLFLHGSFEFPSAATNSPDTNFTFPSPTNDMFLIISGSYSRDANLVSVVYCIKQAATLWCECADFSVVPTWIITEVALHIGKNHVKVV